MKLSDVRINDDTPLGRTGWTFDYGPQSLMEASRKLADWHRGRESFYQHEAVRIEDELRKSGMELREQQVTGGPQFSAVVDQQLGQQLSEARQRRERHANSARTFEAYAGAFELMHKRESTNSTKLKLTIADVDYFALHREPGD